MKNRATSYTDFYKNSSKPPANQDKVNKPGTPGYGIPESDEAESTLKKEALKRRLKRTSAAMRAKAARK